MTAIEDVPEFRTPLLSRERTIARPGFNRWLVPPAALAIHLCIGMAYGFSVFWLPLSRAIGIADPVACEGMSLLSALFTTSCDWRIADLAGSIRCSSCCWDPRPRCGEAGWRSQDHARQASSPPCAGAVAWSSRGSG